MKQRVTIHTTIEGSIPVKGNVLFHFTRFQTRNGVYSSAFTFETMSSAIYYTKYFEFIRKIEKVVS